MLIFMLIGTLLFTGFLLLCMIVSRDMKTYWKIELSAIAAGLLAWGVEYLIGRPGLILPVLLVHFLITEAFLLKNLKKFIMFTFYTISYIIGFFLIFGITFTLLRIPVPDQAMANQLFFIPSILILTLGSGLVSLLKKRWDFNFVERPVFHFLNIVASLSLIFQYLIMNIQERENLMLFMSLLFLGTTGSIMVLILRHFLKEKGFQQEIAIAQASKLYLDQLEADYQTLRVVKHDYVNILTTLKINIDEGNLEALRKFYYEELDPLNQDLLQESRLHDSLYQLQISEIKSILLYKSALAAKAGIKLRIEVKETVSQVPVKVVIICQILGILLDNALEAAQDTQEKTVEVAIVSLLDATRFIIRNTWIPQKYPPNKYFESGFSTKGPNRGTGLHTVRSYAYKIKGLFLETETTDQYFTQILTVKE